MIIRCIACGSPVPEGYKLPNNECYCEACKGKFNIKYKQPTQKETPPQTPSRSKRKA